MLNDKERSFLWPFTLIRFCWLSPCFVVALPNLNPVSPRLHHEPRSISTVLRALANLKKRCLFRRTRWWKPRILCRCVSRKRQQLNDIIIYKPCCVCSWQKRQKTQALKLYHGLICQLDYLQFCPFGHGHARPSVEEVFTKVSRQMSLEHQPPADVDKGLIDGKWPQKNIKNIKKHLCRSIYKASKNRM